MSWPPTISRRARSQEFDMDWTSFFLGAAGAAATLMGLLFVGVQFQIDTLMADLRWQAVARSTFTMYVCLFIIPLVLIVPTLDNATRAIALLIIIAVGILRAVRTWLPVWRSPQQRQRERLWQAAWLLVGPLGVYASLAISAIHLYRATQTDAIYTGLAVALIGFFPIVLRNSWNLLFEIAAEQHRRA
jgi:hypothetical protein